MQQIINSTYPSNAFGRFWMKVPLVIRSILTGFGVTTIGVGIWVLLVRSLPAPWSVMAMGAVLVVYCIYFSGKWGPSSTKGFRRSCTRQIKLERAVWIWGMMAAFFLFLIVQSGLILSFRTVKFHPETFKTFRYLNELPAWSAWSTILMGSLVAGICEEIGYRGFMQTPLEQKYGPVIGISITSLIFTVSHIHQAWASGALVQIFLISCLIGYLAYSTRSLIPGIVAHVSFDIVNFAYWWSDLAGTFERKPISMTGVDAHFILTVAVVLLSAITFFVAIRYLLRLKKTSS